jgi:hypothetical protein
MFDSRPRPGILQLKVKESALLCVIHAAYHCPIERGSGLEATSDDGSILYRWVTLLGNGFGESTTYDNVNEHRYYPSLQDLYQLEIMPDEAQSLSQ